MPQVHTVFVTSKEPVGDDTNVTFLLLTIGGGSASASEDGCTVPGDTVEENFDLEVLRLASVENGAHGDIFVLPPGVAVRHVKGS